MKSELIDGMKKTYTSVNAYRKHHEAIGCMRNKSLESTERDLFFASENDREMNLGIVGLFRVGDLAKTLVKINPVKGKIYFPIDTEDGSLKFNKGEAYKFLTIHPGYLDQFLACFKK